MAGLEIIQSFLQQASIQGSKSTILKPMNWILSIIISAIIATFYFPIPNWVSITFIVIFIILIIAYLIIYFYCLFNDRDALRSETYNVQKLAIEKGIIGDSATGILDLNKEVETKLLLDEPQSESESE